jgi:hypothetical protein
MCDIELKLGGGRVVRTVNGGESEVLEYEFGYEDEDGYFVPTCMDCGNELDPNGFCDCCDEDDV